MKAKKKKAKKARRSPRITRLERELISTQSTLRDTLTALSHTSARAKAAGERADASRNALDRLEGFMNDRDHGWERAGRMESILLNLIRRISNNDDPKRAAQDALDEQAGRPHDVSSELIAALRTQ